MVKLLLPLTLPTAIACTHVHKQILATWTPTGSVGWAPLVFEVSRCTFEASMNPRTFEFSNAHPTTSKHLTTCWH